MKKNMAGIIALLMTSILCEVSSHNGTITRIYKRKLTSTDVYYGICRNGIDAYPKELITEAAYIEYIKCHPKELFKLEPQIRTREFINNLIKSKPEIFVHIPLFLRTLEQEYVYHQAMINKNFYDCLTIATLVCAAVFFIYKELYL